MGIYSQIANGWSGASQAQRDRVLQAASTAGRSQYQAFMSGGSAAQAQATQVLNTLPPAVQAAILGTSGAAAGSGGASTGSGPAASTAGTLTPASSGAGSAAKSAYELNAYDTIKANVMTDPNDLDAMGLSLTSKASYEALKGTYDKMRNDLGLSADKMNAANEAFLKGEIPTDVMAQVRRSASQSSVAGGLFGQGARAMTAADLGLTSLQMVQTGIQQQGQIAGVQEVAAKLDEARRQFNQQYDLNVNAFQDTVRNTNLRGLALEESRLQFNSSQNLSLMSNVLDLVKMQQQLGYSYAASGTDPGGMAETFDSWINEVRSQLTGG